MSSFAPAFSRYDVVVMDYEGDDWPSQTTEGLCQLCRRRRWPRAAARCQQRVSRVEGIPRDLRRWRMGRTRRDVGTDGALARRPDGARCHDARHRDASARSMISWSCRGRRIIPSCAVFPPSGCTPTMRSTVNCAALPPTCRCWPRRPRAGCRGGTGEHEPMFMTIAYGQGRVFHNTLGHAGPADAAPVPSLSCVGLHRLDPARDRVGRDRRGDAGRAARFSHRDTHLTSQAVAVSRPCPGRPLPSSPEQPSRRALLRAAWHSRARVQRRDSSCIARIESGTGPRWTLRCEGVRCHRPARPQRDAGLPERDRCVHGRRRRHRARAARRLHRRHDSAQGQRHARSRRRRNALPEPGQRRSSRAAAAPWCSPRTRTTSP